MSLLMEQWEGNACQYDEDISTAICEAICEYDKDLIVYYCAGAVLGDIAESKGLRTASEILQIVHTWMIFLL